MNTLCFTLVPSLAGGLENARKFPPFFGFNTRNQNPITNDSEADLIGSTEALDPKNRLKL